MGSGSKFVVNILKEGDHKKLMGQLSKPFKPGESRFEGIDIEVSFYQARVYPTARAKVEEGAGARGYTIYSTILS